MMRSSKCRVAKASRSWGSGVRCTVRVGLMVLAAFAAAASASGADPSSTSTPTPTPNSVSGGSSDADRSLIARLSWLSGCWQQSKGDRIIEEQWMAPRGGTMLGMGRTVKGDKTGDYEVMRIEEGDGHLVFTAHPSGQEEASFTSVELTNTKVVFENPSHDFPQRVVYRRLPDGSMAARGIK